MDIERCCDALNCGILYKLYKSHPGIDFVGKLNDTIGRSWLVMIQLSVSRYTKYCSKVWHIDQEYLNYPEFANKTVLSYYQSLSSVQPDGIIDGRI